MNGGKTSTGGAATARGIWYQALWVVLQAAAVRNQTDNSSSPSQGDDVMRLVVEPKGGDVRIEHTKSHRIVQLKVLHKGAWSLKDVICEIFPDLYRAVNLTDEFATYEFVTEGRQGRWNQALTFFNGLGGRITSGAYRKVPIGYRCGRLTSRGSPKSNKSERSSDIIE